MRFHRCISCHVLGTLSSKYTCETARKETWKKFFRTLPLRDFLHMSPDARQNEETTFRVGEIIFILLMDQGLMFRICQ